MTVKIKKTVTVTDPTGTKVVLADTDKPIITTDAIFVCDNPRCAARQGEFATSFSWNEQEAEKDFRSLPDGFFTLLKVIPDPLGQEAVVFCGAACAKDWLTYSYNRPLSKKEHIEKIQVNAAAQIAMDAQDPQMKLPFPEETCAR